MTIQWVIGLLPIVFMLHDFEELIMFEPWLRKNRAEIARRFPRVDRVLRAHHDQLSTAGFAVAVSHEFVIVAGITTAALAMGAYGLWFGALAAFSLHLLVHIGQWIVYRKYVPCVLTAVLALPYCVYAFERFLATTTLSAGDLGLWATLGVALTLLSFPSAFWLAARFERWKNVDYLGERAAR